MYPSKYHLFSHMRPRADDDSRQVNVQGQIRMKRQHILFQVLLNNSPIREATVLPWEKRVRGRDL